MTKSLTVDRNPERPSQPLIASERAACIIQSYKMSYVSSKKCQLEEACGRLASRVCWGEKCRSQSVPYLLNLKEEAEKKDPKDVSC